MTDKPMSDAGLDHTRRVSEKAMSRGGADIYEIQTAMLIAKIDELQEELNQSFKVTTMQRCNAHPDKPHYRPRDGCPWCKIDALKETKDE